ncbi:tRNA pseudouridine(13) synthase TruD [Candidatus Nitrosoglobus terrae]|uniref:tRNA pseudouridine(13) synthase TruD n=1 Tax=Candidatus Nitrosoglobus terrae TaxID=1630141 RepID=UPI001E54EAFB|nr:tRNA pseudouridine(13) synthase TruD [Candidatus Nitrosoglobus terrae]
MLNGSRGFFTTEDIDKSVQDRVKCFDCHPSGPLWGQGKSFTIGFIRTFEEQALLDFALWREGLKQERRSLRLMITDLKWSFPTKDSLQLQFFLPAGSYATTVLREFVSI